MTNEDILNKAQYILFPYMNKSYHSYDVSNHYIYKTPIIETEDLSEVIYINMPTNKHHYTYKYHIKYVLPLLNSLFNFGYNINDFNLIEFKHEYGDLSYLKPKIDYTFEVVCFTDNTKEILKFEDLKPIDKDNVSYRDLYRFPHKCSKVINLDINNDRKIFISGDSQIIPDIAILACYYKEVWYFDNRTGKSLDWSIIDKEKTISFNDNYKNINFDDVLIELYTNPIWWYTEINLM